MGDTLNEKCAVTSVSTREVSSEAAHVAYQSLFALQHRGVEGSGIVTNGDGTRLHAVRRPGMVRDVYTDEDIASLYGSTAIGHNRYSTNGERHLHLQPVTNEAIQFAFAHNGNLPDPHELASYLKTRRYRTAQYNDSELLGHTIASKLHGGRSIEQAVRESMELAVGAYACVLSYDGMTAAFRDQHGIRPLELGTYDGGVVAASETCALDTIGADHLRSVTPGELVIMDRGKIVDEIQIASPTPRLDIFEFVYFARHDSYLYGERVNEVRRRFGVELAHLHPSRSGAYNSVVVPIPDTSIPAAEGYAATLALPNRQAVVKNRYVGRTFMQPSQASRRSNLQLKHTIVSEQIRGKDVIFIDDSIVRGNTMPRLVTVARNMGAKSVSVLIASPPVRFPDFYGVDTPSQSELMAAHMSVEDMRRLIDCDYLGFLSVSAMVRATGKSAELFNLAAFTGEYPVSIGRHAATISAPATTEYID